MNETDSDEDARLKKVALYVEQAKACRERDENAIAARIKYELKLKKRAAQKAAKRAEARRDIAVAVADNYAKYAEQYA